MQYHPDVNPSANAQEKFILITEAYEVLSGIRSAKRNISFRTAYGQASGRTAGAAYRYDPEKHREKFARERAHRMRYAGERVRRHAQRERAYEEFIRNNDSFQHSWYFRPMQIFVFLVSVAGMAFGLFLMASPFLVGYYFYLKGSHWVFGSLCLPLIAAGVQVIYQSICLRKEAAPYFTKNSGFE